MWDPNDFQDTSGASNLYSLYSSVAEAQEQGPKEGGHRGRNGHHKCSCVVLQSVSWAEPMILLWMGQRNPAPPKGCLKAYEEWDKPSTGAGFLPSTVATLTTNMGNGMD